MPGRATPPATARRESAAPVAFIAGAGRSGSTLLERILQQFDGVVPVGELRWLWTSSWSSIVCECGQATTDCAFWAAVVERASGGAPDPWRAHVRELVERALRFRVVPSLAVSRPGPRLDADLIEIGAALARLYEAIRFVSDASTIVDASKLPLHAVAASRSDAVDLRVVHLVRNPEAVAFSWTRSVELPHRSGIPMKTLRPARSALGWLIANLEADLLTHTGVPSLRVLYEDLAESPVRATARISDFLDLGSPYTTQMYSDFIAQAYNANYEFVTLEDLASRIMAQQKASIDYTTAGNTITATVTPDPTAPDLGAMALDVDQWRHPGDPERHQLVRL